MGITNICIIINKYIINKIGIGILFTKDVFLPHDTIRTNSRR